MSVDLKIGQFNKLAVVKELHFGAYLDGGEWGELLLPAKVVPKGIKNGDLIDVFLYFDSEDRPIATTIKPLAVVGECAVMEVVGTNEFGAFLNWGVTAKDLLLPFKEQTRAVGVGDRVAVHVCLDPKQGRVIASMRLDKFKGSAEAPAFNVRDEVSLIICRKSDMGYPAVINKTHWGLLFANEVFEELYEGDERTGYVKNIREDCKIDLTLHKLGYQKVESSLNPILEKLKANQGFLAVTDKSSPEAIYALFGISKKTYKQSVGALFKQRLISIDRDGIRIVTQ